ncbi:MAG: tyrosine-type recombinase/integrase [Longibaculum sp.]
MSKRILKEEILDKYIQYLIDEEKSTATIQKYVCDIRKFYNYVGDHTVITKQIVLDYKKHLQDLYKASSANSMIVALNGFFLFNKWNELKIKTLRIQKSIFKVEKEELNDEEYGRLLETAKSKNNERLFMLMQAICSTGIRVSEHKYITVEAVKKGYMTIHSKGKIRDIFFPKELKKGLFIYCQKHKIKTGPVFITSGGKILDRSNIYRMMQSLCREARVDAKKVYPHNLRHLFAITYYTLEKDIIHLADILGHSSIETTRIYLKSNGKECQKVFNKMKLIRMIV